MRRVMTGRRAAALLAGCALVPLLANSAVAAPAASAQRQAMWGCRTSTLTDVVDRTTRVSAGGSISCDKVLTPDFMSLIIFVELYRNGTKVAAATKACPGKYSCWAGVEFTDNTAGNQKWQAKATYGGVWTEVKWGNVLYH
ncbi:hypothetical protein SMD20_39975 [Nonomuraea sp. LP-02]|uniref:hypothetical protein n=1 Tax=Nonomuraea sp. LP-02 TaxID=3097960 RepID=UPI002E3722C7|nr:hypothetical protein [Nonomuraea sp. LP-02]MED7930459.1 hypothetical protein [Nonomuraea sp. LP-02]